MNDNKQIDVFISRKSEDAKYAKAIYDYLTKEGLNVFESDQSLKEMGNAEYSKAIDEIIVETTHLMVVASSKEYLSSGWVEAEWRFFLNRKRSGKASGNLFTVICSDMKLDEVPASLQNYEVIPYNKENFPTIFNYCRKENQTPKKEPDNPRPFKSIDTWFKKATVFLIISVLLAVVVVTYYVTRPFDATVFLKEADINISKDYPPFQRGTLSLFVEGNEYKKEVLSNGEVNFRELAFAVKNEWVKAEYDGKYWKLAKDSVLLNPNTTIDVIPNESLAEVYGHVFDSNGNPLAQVSVQIDSDTVITSDQNGIFKTILPISIQKLNYTLLFSKDGYLVSKEKYYPQSGKIDVLLNSL